MKTCIAIQHLSFEHLGSFEHVFENQGYRIRYMKPHQNGLAEAYNADLVVILGGPIGVYETLAYPYINDEIALTKYRLSKHLPILGICLGAQIIALAAGGEVFPGKRGKEIGWHPIHPASNASTEIDDCLFSGGGSMFHWHGDTLSLPDGAQLLASSSLYENQIFALGNNVLGIQCHPELVPDDIENWLIGHACEIAITDSVNVTEIREDTKKYGQELVSRSQYFIASWLQDLKT